MTKRVISSPDAPAAIGPYSQAVQVGELVFFSGQIPLDPATGEVVEGGVAEQTEQVMKNMRAVLSEAGLEFRHVVKTTIYMTDLAAFSTVNDIYGRFFPEAPPARATVEVAGLPKGVAVEIEWVAHTGA